MTRFSFLAAAAVMMIASAACTDEPPRAESADTTPVRPAPPPAAYDSLAACPGTGKWDVCSVMYRLKRAGFLAARDSEPAREKKLDQVGMRLALGQGSISVFIYPDTLNRHRDERDLDSTEFVSVDGFPNPNKRTVLRSENMLVLMAVPNERNRQRIIDALTAGPPMAAPPDSTKRK